MAARTDELLLMMRPGRTAVVTPFNQEPGRISEIILEIHQLRDKD